MPDSVEWLFLDWPRLRLWLTIKLKIPQGDTRTKIVVDYNRCESNARCVQVAPDIFEVRDDDKLYLLNEHPPASARERVMKAIRVCPKQALSLVEDN